MRGKLIMAGALAFCLQAYSQQSIRLNDLDLSKIWQEYGSIVNGKTVVGEPAIVNGQTRTDVLGLQAKSIAKIKLDGKGIRFTAQVGVTASSVKPNDPSLVVQPLVDGCKLLFAQEQDTKQFKGLVGSDNQIGKGSVIFQLKLDGKEIYNSGLLRSSDGFKTVDVNLEKGGLLELFVDPTSDGASGDEVLLVNPQVTYAGEKPELVDANALGEGPQQQEAVVKQLQQKIG